MTIELTTKKRTDRLTEPTINRLNYESKNRTAKQRRTDWRNFNDERAHHNHQSEQH